MAEPIYLWKDTAPYSEQSPEQAQPSILPYIVEGSRGAVIVLAGGGYFKKTAYEAFPVAEAIAEMGVSAFVLDYRIKPCDKMAPSTDTSRAIRYVRSMGFEKVAILGFSAGGNAVCTAATHYDFGNPDSSDPIERYSSRPDLFIPCYAVTSLIAHTHAGSVRNLLGDQSSSSEWLKYFSAEYNITRDTPPAFIWHCVDDPAVPVECALELAKQLSLKGIKYELHLFPDGGHGLGLANDNPSVRQWQTLLGQYLLLNGYSK